MFTRALLWHKLYSITSIDWRGKNTQSLVTCWLWMRIIMLHKSSFTVTYVWVNVNMTVWICHEACIIKWAAGVSRNIVGRAECRCSTLSSPGRGQKWKHIGHRGSTSFLFLLFLLQRVMWYPHRESCGQSQNFKWWAMGTAGAGSWCNDTFWLTHRREDVRNIQII